MHDDQKGQPDSIADPINAAILRILAADGRIPFRAIAERVHISRANVYARIHRLRSEGVLRGFTASIDHERAGLTTTAYLTLKIANGAWLTLRPQLQRLPGARHIALVNGDFDVLLLVHTRNNHTLRELVLTELQNMPEIISTRTLLVFDYTDPPIT